MNKEELLKQLLEAKQNNPDAFDAAIAKHPELWELIVSEKRRIELVAIVHASDSPESFFAYYEGKYGFEPPWQVKRWINKIYEGRADNKGFTVNGYRGSWKTVSVSITFTEYRIGKEPSKRNLVVRAGEDTANEITDKITNTIEKHPWWKVCFPNVVRDEDARWSRDGYWVVDTSVERDEWTKIMSISPDPTLIGGGYTSQKINGKHPTGVCLTDDLHGINNSSSETERKAATKFYTTELAKTFIRHQDKLMTWPINVGVPWGRDDTHQTLKKSGGFVSDELPVMTRANEGDENAVYIDGVNEETGTIFEDIKGWWVLSNPDSFGVEAIKRDRGLGKYDFWQMMMMDLTMARAGGLQYYPFFHKDVNGNRTVDVNWPHLAGCDPSASFKEKLERSRKNSHFALAVGAKRPLGGAVITGGDVDQCNPGKAVSYILAKQSMYPNWISTFVENVGFGITFIELLHALSPYLIITTSDLGGIRVKGQKAAKSQNKWDRFKNEVSPFLEDGTILVSDERSEFLDTLRDALDNFAELDPNKADKRWDVLDSVYHFVKAIPDVLFRGRTIEEVPLFSRKKVSVHPLSGMNQSRGYG